MLTPKEWNNYGKKPQQMWAEVVQAGVLIFSDTQILTGIAVLVSGYIQLPSGLGLYHWEIVVDLALFSSLTHLTTLTALRDYFRQRTTMAVIRTICMGVNLALLVIAMVPLGYSLTRIASPAHAVCLFEFNIPRKRLRQMSGSPALKCLGNPNDLNDFNTAFVAIAWTFLLVSYATRVIRLFPGSATRARKYLRSWPGNFAAFIYTLLRDIRDSTCYGILQKFLSVILFLFRAAYILGKAVCDVAESMSYEVSRIWATICRLLTFLRGLLACSCA